MSDNWLGALFITLGTIVVLGLAVLAWQNSLDERHTCQALLRASQSYTVADIKKC